MSQDLLGLTIHVAPEGGVESETAHVKQLFWENAQISEQFEEIVLNSTHRIIYAQLAETVSSLSKDNIRVEIVAQFDESALEEWFAVGIELLSHNRDHVLHGTTLTCSHLANALCQELQARIMMMLIGEIPEPRLTVEVEITNYAGMWG